MHYTTLATCCYALGFLLLLASPLKAQQAGPVTEEVQFSNGDLTLAASLLLPPGNGPFPGVVLVHGSGSSDRSNPWTLAYAEALVERGLAVLHPDKRGAGESGGSWQTASFLDLADDAIAAVNLLQAHPKVDAEQVGVIGFSQGGHIVPAAAARATSIAYVINVSGSTVPIMEQIGDEITKMGEREGLSEEDIATLESVHALGVRYALSGNGWDAYAEALAEAKKGRMGGKEVVEGFPTTEDSPAWGFLRTIGDFDPMVYWKELDVPLLFIYGGRDTQIRVQKSVNRIQDVLGPLELNYTLMLFNNNGHALYRKDALDFIATWIQRKGET